MLLIKFSQVVLFLSANFLSPRILFDGMLIKLLNLLIDTLFFITELLVFTREQNNRLVRIFRVGTALSEKHLHKSFGKVSQSGLDHLGIARLFLLHVRMQIFEVVVLASEPTEPSCYPVGLKVENCWCLEKLSLSFCQSTQALILNKCACLATCTFCIEENERPVPSAPPYELKHSLQFLLNLFLFFCVSFPFESICEEKEGFYMIVVVSYSHK